MTQICTTHRGSGFESSIRWTTFSCHGLLAWYIIMIILLLFCYLLSLNSLGLTDFGVDPMWKYDWLKGYLHSMTDSSRSTNIHFCLGCAFKHKAWTNDGSTYHADPPPFPSLPCRPLWACYAIIWFDYKIGSACSTLSVGRDPRRVKKSNKERTVGSDFLSPFFLSILFCAFVTTNWEPGTGQFLPEIWCQVRYRTQDHLNQNYVCFVDGNLRFKCRELHILYSTLCKRGRVPADWTSAASRNSGSWALGREACSPDFSSVNVSSGLRMSRFCSMWGVSGGSSLQNLMIGLQGVGFKYWGWMWSGDVTVSFWEVVAALESRSPWSTRNKSSPSHWGHFQSWL